MKDTAQYSIPKEPGRWRAISLAVVVHAALLAFLWIGVRWQSESPVGIEAEVWSPQNQEAAPRPEPPPPSERKPEPAPEPKPLPKETPPPPKPPVAEPVRENPDIALEQEKKRKAQQERQEREERDRQAKLKQQKLEQEREQKQAQAEKERLERQKEKEKAEALAKKEKEAEQAKKLAADKLAAEKKRKQEAQEAAAAEQRRTADMQRMLAQAGTGGTGHAAQAQGSRADSSYIQKVGSRIKSNTIFNVPEGLTGNPAVEFAVELLPDGSIRGLSKVKSSGVPGFDEAVQRAIGKSAPFPPDQSGRVPAGFNVVHHPKDQ